MRNRFDVASLEIVTEDEEDMKIRRSVMVCNEIALDLLDAMAAAEAVKMDAVADYEAYYSVPYDSFRIEATNDHEIVAVFDSNFRSAFHNAFPAIQLDVQTFRMAAEDKAQTANITENIITQVQKRIC